MDYGLANRWGAFAKSETRYMNLARRLNDDHTVPVGAGPHAVHPGLTGRAEGETQRLLYSVADVKRRYGPGSAA